MSATVEQKEEFLKGVWEIYRILVQARDAMAAHGADNDEILYKLNQLINQVDTDQALPLRLDALKNASFMTKVSEGKSILWDPRLVFYKILHQGPKPHDQDIVAKMQANPSYFELCLMISRMAYEFTRQRPEIKRMKDFLYEGQYAGQFNAMSFIDGRIANSSVESSISDIKAPLRSALIHYLRNHAAPGAQGSVLASIQAGLTALNQHNEQRFTQIRERLDQIAQNQSFDQMTEVNDQIDQLKSEIKNTTHEQILARLPATSLVNTDDQPNNQGRVEPNFLADLIHGVIVEQDAPYSAQFAQLTAQYNELYKNGMTFEKLNADIQAELTDVAAVKKSSTHNELIQNQNLAELIENARTHRARVEALKKSHDTVRTKIEAQLKNPQAEIERLSLELRREQDKVARLKALTQTAELLVRDVWNFKNHVNEAQFAGLITELYPEEHREKYRQDYREFSHAFKGLFGVKKGSEISLPSLIKQKHTQQLQLAEQTVARLTEQKIQAEAVVKDLEPLRAQIKELGENCSTIKQCETMLTELDNSIKASQHHQICHDELTRIQALDQSLNQFVQDARTRWLNILEALAKFFGVKEHNLPGKLQCIHVVEAARKDLCEGALPIIEPTIKKNFNNDKCTTICFSKTTRATIANNKLGIFNSVKIKEKDANFLELAKQQVIALSS